MKFNILIPAALALTGSTQAFLKANEPCGNNKECETNCSGGTYHVVGGVNNTASFACSLQDSNPKYDVVTCSKGLRGVCQAGGGRYCIGTGASNAPKGTAICILNSGEESDFDSICKKISGERKTVKSTVDYGDAIKGYHCGIQGIGIG